MHRKTIGGVVGVLLVLALLAAAAAPAFASTTTKRWFGPYSKSRETYHIDRGRNGPSTGDQFGGYFRLYRHHHNRAIFYYQCTIQRMHPRRDFCRGDIVVFTRGQLIVEGVGHGRFFHAAITGGTHHFRDASGTLRLRFDRHGVHVKAEIIR